MQNKLPEFSKTPGVFVLKDIFKHLNIMLNDRGGCDKRKVKGKNDSSIIKP